MGIELGKNLLAVFGGSPSYSKGVASSGGVVPAYKTAPYAAIKAERAPQVLDTVPTTDAYGNPLLAGYSTPKKVWVA